MNKTYAAIVVLFILSSTSTVLTVFEIYRESQPEPQPIPTFLSMNSDGTYSILFSRGQCVTEITLTQKSGIWFETGHGDGCSTGEIPSYQKIIYQAISERNGCFYFFKSYNGTVTLRYTTSNFCGDPWHTVVVSK